MSNVPASPSVRGMPDNVLALSFRWAVAVFATLAPMLLAIYALATSADAVERAQLMVQGLESTVLALVAALIVRAVVVFATEDQPRHAGGGKRRTRVRSLGELVTD